MTTALPMPTYPRLPDGSFNFNRWFAKFDPELLADPEGRRILTRLDPLLFAILYRNHALMQGTGDLTFADMHLELAGYGRGWVRPWHRNPMKGARDIFVAPRDSGKSTWLFNILPMWAAAHGHIEFMTAFAGTASMAMRWLGNFKRQMLTNNLLAQDFPDLCINPIANNTHQYTARNGFNFMAFGIDGMSLGTNIDDKRPDLILLDDIERGEGTYSPFQVKQRLATVVSAILPMNHRAHTVMVGTTLMPGSLMHQAIKAARGEEPSSWIREERFNVHHFLPFLPDQASLGEERSFWEGKFPLDELKDIRETRSFRTDFMNDPMAWDGQYWKDTDFIHEANQADVSWLISVDPATTANQKSDETGIAVLSYSPSEGRVCVHHAEGLRVTPDEMRDRVLQLITSRFPQVKRILVENNQGGLTWQNVFHGLPPGVDLRFIHNTDRKEVRAANALAYYNVRRVTHATKLHRAEEQMIAFPHGQNDDIVDAVGAGVLYFFNAANIKPTKPAPKLHNMMA